MSISLKDLKNPQNEDNRKVRDFVATPQGVIEVYEPTIDDIVDIIEIQREESQKDEYAEEIEFSASAIIKKLFPLLTNIDLTDLSDDELIDIIESPSIHLLTVQQIVAQIVQEANKFYAQKVKTEIINAESTMAQVDLINTIPSVILNGAKVEGNSNELMKNVEKAEKELEESIAKEKELKKQIDAIELFEKDSESKASESNIEVEDEKIDEKATPSKVDEE